MHTVVVPEESFSGNVSAETAIHRRKDALTNEAHVCVGTLLGKQLLAGGGLDHRLETAHLERELAAFRARLGEHGADPKSAKGGVVGIVDRRDDFWVGARGGVGEHVDDFGGL